MSTTTDQHNQQLDLVSLLQSHRSIRKFKDQPLTEAQIESIIHSAQMASTSSHVQAYTILGITDSDKKKKLAEYAGNQNYVETCGHFLVFCADLHRLNKVAEKEGVDIASNLEYTEMFIVGTVDAALAAQNAAVAAEALGLGVVYIGGIRNNPDKVSQLLELPEQVYPVFGMCIGYPDQHPDIKPRLPQPAIYFENTYQPFEQVERSLEEYDQKVKEYYIARTGGKRAETWSEMMVKTLSTPRRAFMKDFLKNQGFPLK